MDLDNLTTSQRIKFLKVAEVEATKMSLNRNIPIESRNICAGKADKYRKQVKELEKIDKKTLKMIDKSVKNLAEGKVGEPIDFEELEEILEDLEEILEDVE